MTQEREDVCACASDSPTHTGQAGELLTRGYSVMLGYWGDEEKTRDAITEDGWMRTGDMATISHDGVYIWCGSCVHGV